MSKRKVSDSASVLVNETNMVYSSVPYVGIALKKNIATTLKVYK